MRVALFFAFVFSLVSYAEQSTFSEVTPIGEGSTIRRMVATSRGVVAAGDAIQNGRRVIALARYRADGSLDSTFGNGGTTTSAIGSILDLGFAVEETIGGKILVAGWSFETPVLSRFFLARFDKRGNLDPSFGTNGVVFHGAPGWSFGAYAMAVQKDGKIVVLAQAVRFFPYNYHFLVARYLPNGNLDDSFGTSGMTLLPLEGGFPHAVQIASSGKIVIAGHFLDGDAYRFVLQRLSSSGALDPSFGNAGTVVTGFGAGIHSVCEKIALDENDGIYAAGSVATTPEHLALLHYRADGSLDPDFGNLGRALVTIGSAAHAMDLVVGANDVTVAGYGQPGSEQSFAIVRFLRDGTLDDTFGTGGIFTVAVGNGNSHAESLVLLDSGDLVVGGSAADELDRQQFAVIGVAPKN